MSIKACLLVAEQCTEECVSGWTLTLGYVGRGWHRMWLWGETSSKIHNDSFRRHSNWRKSIKSREQSGVSLDYVCVCMMWRKWQRCVCSGIWSFVYVWDPQTSVCRCLCFCIYMRLSLLCAGLFLQLTSNEAKWLQLKSTYRWNMRWRQRMWKC